MLLIYLNILDVEVENSSSLSFTHISLESHDTNTVVTAYIQG